MLTGRGDYVNNVSQGGIVTNLPNKELLDRWCLIATELNVSERTAMRYHTNHGLPVSYDPAGHPVTTKELLAAWKTKNIQGITGDVK